MILNRKHGRGQCWYIGKHAPGMQSAFPKILQITMLRISFLMFLLFSLCKVSLCQKGNSTFYPDGYGMLYERKNVKFISINTENKVEPFFRELNRQFGAPILAGEYTIYKYINKRLSNKKIVIRISRAVQVDLNNKRSNTLFIYIETQNHVDLLDPKKSSSKELKSYFNNLFLKAVVNAPLDNFSE